MNAPDGGGGIGRVRRRRIRATRKLDRQSTVPTATPSSADATSLPAYATVAADRPRPATRGRRRPQMCGRCSEPAAAAWRRRGIQPTSFDVDVQSDRAAVHQVAFYCVDWDTHGAAQRIDVLDATTSVVLDTRTIEWIQRRVSMRSGICAGHVRVRFTRTGGANAVVSGIFFGAGEWRRAGKHGDVRRAGFHDAGNLACRATVRTGYNIFNDAASYPPYATATTTGQSVYTGPARPSDPRASSASGSAAPTNRGDMVQRDVIRHRPQAHRRSGA